MALFGSRRDAKLVRKLNRELVHRWISIEVALYKLSMNDTEINLYNESSQKTYFHPVKIFCIPDSGDITMNDVDTGMDVAQTLTFNFIRDDLKEKNIFIDEGDIIKFNGKYYEVDNLNENQFWIGRNDETLLGNVDKTFEYQFGYNVSVVAACHMTRLSHLNLVETRSGINKNVNKLPKNL